MRNCWLGVPREQHQQLAALPSIRWPMSCFGAQPRCPGCVFFVQGLRFFPHKFLTVGRLYNHRILQQYTLIGHAASRNVALAWAGRITAILLLLAVVYCHTPNVATAPQNLQHDGMKLLHGAAIYVRTRHQHHFGNPK